MAHRPPSCWPASRARWKRAVGVTVSIGLAANRLLAKIAAGRDKPRGFAVIGAAEAASLLAPEPVRLLPGVGPALARRLAAQGITLLGHLQALSDREAQRRLGDEGPSLAARARGEDARRVDPGRETKSISAETTFNTDLTRPADLQAHLWRLAEKLARRLKEHELSAGGVVLKLKTTDFAIRTRAVAPAEPDGAARPAVRRRQRTAGARGHRDGVPPDRHRRQPAAAAGGGRSGDLADTETPRRAATQAAIDALRQRYRRRRRSAAAAAGPGPDHASGGAAAMGISRASGWSPMPGAPGLGLLGLGRWLAAILAVGPARAALLLAVLLALLRRLVHRVQDAEIVLGVLEIALRHHPVAAAGRVAAELEVFLEQLLRRPADAQIGTIAVEHVVAVERNAAASTAPVMPQPATAATPAATWSMAASTHAFHVHYCCCRAFSVAGRRLLGHAGQPAGVPGECPLGLASIQRHWFRRVPRPTARAPGASRCAAGPAGEEARLPAPRCQTVFSWQCPAEHKGAWDSRQIGPRCHGEAGLPRQSLGRLRLSRADFQHGDAFGGEQRGKARKQPAIGREYRPARRPARCGARGAPPLA